MRIVTIMTEVEVDLDDYVDEILEECKDDDLINEITKRGHGVYRKKDRITAFGDQPINFNSPEDLRRFLCDIAGVGYYTSKETLLNEIKSKLS
jgi:hypothetical protein